jgi:hypothetical protein
LRTTLGAERGLVCAVLIIGMLSRVGLSAGVCQRFKSLSADDREQALHTFNFSINAIATAGAPALPRWTQWIKVRGYFYIYFNILRGDMVRFLRYDTPVREGRDETAKRPRRAKQPAANRGRFGQLSGREMGKFQSRARSRCLSG